MCDCHVGSWRVAWKCSGPTAAVTGRKTVGTNQTHCNSHIQFFDRNHSGGSSTPTRFQSHQRDCEQLTVDTRLTALRHPLGSRFVRHSPKRRLDTVDSAGLKTVESRVIPLSLPPPPGPRPHTTPHYSLDSVLIPVPRHRFLC